MREYDWILVGIGAFLAVFFVIDLVSDNARQKAHDELEAMHACNAQGIEELHSKLSQVLAECRANRCECGDDSAEETPVVVVEKPVKRIYFHTMPGGGCPPCDAWKRTELDKAVADGWEVEVVEGGCKSYPRFRVYADIKKPGVWKVGFATFKELKGMVE